MRHGMNTKRPAADGASQNGRLNLDWSTAVIAGLAAAGVRDVVVSPGARSTPLTLACLRHPALRCEIVLDERSAAWFALGRVKADGRPVALVCTSGTAAANWLPAVVEASQRALPLLLLSADRPPELQGWGANQTIAQGALFAGQVRASHAPGAPFAGFSPAWLHQLAARALADCRWPLPGPVHLNLAFREPLLPAEPAIDFGADAAATIDTRPPTLTPDRAAVAMLAERLSGRRGVIVCGEGADDATGNGGTAVDTAVDTVGDSFADAVTALAAVLACPILAEPLSGLRFGPHCHDRVFTAHERWLREAPVAPDWVLRFGAWPVTRTLQALLADCETHYLVEAHGRWPDPEHRTRQLLRGDPTLAARALAEARPAPAPAAWLEGFRAREAAAEARHEAAAASASLPPEAILFSALCARLPAGSQLFCGNSMPIRDLAAWSGGSTTPIRIHANRGASGIDGNIATAAGIAASGPTVAVIGDLTAQHDLGSLALMRKQPLVLVVINNGGGGIFDFLPTAALPEFEAAWLTPQQLDFASAATAFGIAFARCDDPLEAVSRCLAALDARAPLLIELCVDRRQSLGLRRAQ